MALELAPERMWNPSRWTQQVARRVVRKMLRAVRNRATISDLLTLQGAWVSLQDGPWQLGLMRYQHAEHVHLVLAVRPLDDRARWEDLPVLFRAFGMPERATPAVQFDDVPLGEPLYFMWRPLNDRARNAPDKVGLIPTEQAREALATAVRGGYDAVLAVRARVAQAEQDADAQLEHVGPPPEPRLAFAFSLAAALTAGAADEPDERDMDNEGG